MVADIEDDTPESWLYSPAVDLARRLEAIPRTTIRVPCPGAGHSATSLGGCRMCGQPVETDDVGVVCHDRDEPVC